MCRGINLDPTKKMSNGNSSITNTNTNIDSAMAEAHTNILCEHTEYVEV